MDLNSILAETYRRYWPNLRNAVSENEVIEKDLSYPLLIHIFPEYESAPIKLFIVGQQTRSSQKTRIRWQKKYEDAPIAELMQQTERFHLGEKHKRAPFWHACYQLNHTLNPSGPEFGFIWSNLIRIDQGGHKPNNDIEEKISIAFPVLPLEIEIAHPDVVVFFTGPSYDARLKKTFKGLKFEAVGNYPSRVLARVIHNSLPYNSYRTYHPVYIRRSRQLELGNIINEIKVSLQGV